MKRAAILALGASLTLIACGTSTDAPSNANAGASDSGAGADPSGAGAAIGGAPNAAAGATPGGGAPPSAGAPSSAGATACSAPTVRITEIDVGAAVNNNEDEVALKPLAISPIPGGGSRMAWYGADSKVHVTTLTADDTVDSSVAPVTIPGNEFGDLYADAQGGVLLVTRNAKGGGTLNCGEPTNLCGTPPSPAVPCYDMYLVRFDGTSETWATQLTPSSESAPPYLASKTGPSVTFIWWYAHHGRIVSDGTNYASYYGAAISVSEGGCVNIHQGDQMRVVSPSGALLTGHQSFDWGCSHSGYERIVWDPSAKTFVTVCKNDAPTGGKSGRLAIAPKTSTILPVDLWYSNVGNLALAGDGGYWLTTTDARAGQPANSDGLADLHLLHFGNGAPDKDIILASEANKNHRATHLASYGAKHLLAAWDTSAAKGDLRPNTADRKLAVQVLDAMTGAAVSQPVPVAVTNNRYHELKAFPDGSVAYPAPGSSNSKLKIARVLPCE